ncbi:hypothetical protein BDM02DRAFT_3193419 [Thelephora ganbajun]|uniref:Uncharacterized protein n=1 Tax=Thelephora ganbajun TaxID=370292 RepID=A0ACB6YY07_THEGA|nr:hypothetical protein BDM02DRAFT_3193419 [Thelephora ganbajun]
MLKKATNSPFFLTSSFFFSAANLSLEAGFLATSSSTTPGPSSQIHQFKDGQGQMFRVFQHCFSALLIVFIFTLSAIFST